MLNGGFVNCRFDSAIVKRELLIYPQKLMPLLFYNNKNRLAS